MAFLELNPTSPSASNLETLAALAHLSISNMEDALTDAPIEGLYEEADERLLPIINVETGDTPFNAYKRPFASTKSPMIAIIVEEFGLSATNSSTAIELLPTEVTFLLSPYASDIDAWQDRARISGHETWVNAPIETKSFPFISDPGSQTIVASDSLKQNNQKLEWFMSRTSGYAGIASLTDDILLASPALQKKITHNLFSRGLAFLELNPTSPSASNLETLAALAKAPYLQADLHINKTTRHESPFKRLEAIAKDKGYAIGILSPSLNTIKQANIWLKSLEAKGIVLAPVSAIAARPSTKRPDASGH